jgi:CBS domain-containing protein
MEKQQTRNEESRSGETPTAFGMMTNDGARPRSERGLEPSPGSVIDRASTSDPAVEHGAQKGPGGVRTTSRGRDDAAETRSDGQRPNGQRANGDNGDGRRAEAQGSRPRKWRQSPQYARDVMTRNPRTVKPTDSVQEIARLMIEEDTGIIPVVDGGRLVGVVTDRDIVCRLVAAGTDLKVAKASDVMTAEVECVTEGDSLQEVLEVMGEHQIRRVAVVGQDDRLVGIIAMADLAREADVDARLQEAFEEISAQRSFWSKMR